MLWIPFTLIAATAQTARNAMQSGLTASLGTLGATQVRFLYGFPFALLFLVAAAVATGSAVPAATPWFLAFTAGGAIVQILATALLLAAMKRGSFSVATALSKTEAVQIAVFGLLILGDHLTWLRSAAIVIATIGVGLTALRPGEKWIGAGLRRPRCWASPRAPASHWRRWGFAVACSRCRRVATGCGPRRP